jgi:hypothetical protein
MWCDKQHLQFHVTLFHYYYYSLTPSQYNSFINFYKYQTFTPTTSFYLASFIALSYLSLFLFSSSSFTSLMGDHNNNNVNLPPGFRFYPTDEELVVHFLHRKASLLPCHPDVIPDLDLYPFDPWQLQGIC